MKWSSVFCICFFIVGVVIGAGCTQPGNTSLPVSTTFPSAPVPLLGTLALTATEVPANYIIIESRAKTADEVGKLAKDQGWQGGYIVKFSNRQGTVNGSTEIVQNLVTYPAAAIPNVIQIAKSNEIVSSTLKITDLPSPGLGELSIAYYGKGDAHVAVQQNDNLILQETARGPVKSDFVEIIFSKGSTMEVLRMSGPGADYEVLRSLARTAYAKLP
jgi:hypothetical protein